MGETPTLADLSLYASTHAREGEIDLDPYGNVRRWHSAVEQLAGHVPMR